MATSSPSSTESTSVDATPESLRQQLTTQLDATKFRVIQLTSMKGGRVKERAEEIAALREDIADILERIQLLDDLLSQINNGLSRVHNLSQGFVQPPISTSTHAASFINASSVNAAVNASSININASAVDAASSVHVNAPVAMPVDAAPPVPLNLAPSPLSSLPSTLR
eukprot:gnl/Spiro4/8494_TR4461_c0_g1_i1.p1 gnl/Spiro4/8494_TR4461_c0_g1~~gnl/Spiro4/8494_TR4461_c0_g1_i1.p1  ORF type:complete len:168 (-),score=42.85 gnl/Spiro4/8494_TR4461_c0_g1_i1:3-506(-)